MKALIQRVKRASVTVEGECISQIGKGLLVFLGVEKADEKLNAEKLAEKISKLRIFEDENDKVVKFLWYLNLRCVLIAKKALALRLTMQAILTRRLNYTSISLNIWHA